jgi:hypothetical protein
MMFESEEAHDFHIPFLMAATVPLQYLDRQLLKSQLLQATFTATIFSSALLSDNLKHQIDKSKYISVSELMPYIHSCFIGLPVSLVAYCKDSYIAQI